MLADLWLDSETTLSYLTLAILVLWALIIGGTAVYGWHDWKRRESADSPMFGALQGALAGVVLGGLPALALAYAAYGLEALVR